MLRGERRNMDCTDMNDLVQQSITIFNRKPITPGFVVTQENIIVGRANKTQVDRETFVPDAPVEKGVLYYIFEYFTTVPTTMFRTVTLEQCESATYSHPDHVSDVQRAFSKASPLLCGATSQTENKEQVFGIKGNKLVPHGISLESKDRAKPAVGSVDPLRPIEIDEPKGDTSMTLQQFGDYVAQKNGSLDEFFGILKTTASHKPSVFGTLELGSPKKMVVNGGGAGATKKPGTATKRETNVRYALKAGIDLRPYQMAIIFDNYDMVGHCTMIRTNFPGRFPGEITKWVFVPLLVPPYERLVNLDLTTDAGVTSMLTPFTNHTKEPETTEVTIARKEYLAHPKVAALFGIYDIVMKASAEPIPPKPFFEPGSPQAILFRAALIMYEECPNHDINAVLQELEIANYNPDNFCELLREELLYEMIWLQGKLDDSFSDDEDEVQGNSFGDDLLQAIEMTSCATEERMLFTPTPGDSAPSLATPASNSSKESNTSKETYTSKGTAVTNVSLEDSVDENKEGTVDQNKPAIVEQRGSSFVPIKEVM